MTEACETFPGPGRASLGPEGYGPADPKGDELVRGELPGVVGFFALVYSLATLKS